jgi:riboflavin synthase alpha subunit
VRDIAGPVLGATVAAETMRRSTFGELTAGQPVHVELPLAAGSALNGHLVQGYADGVGKVARTDAEGDCLRIWIRPPERLMPRLAAKTPIAVDGVSLAIAERLRDRFCVVVVPATRAATTLDRLTPGARVNLELDAVSRLAAGGSVGRSASRSGGRNPATLSQVIAHQPLAGTIGGRFRLDQLLSAFAAGGAVVVWEPHTEGEGDVIFAGAKLRPAAFTFLLTEACGHSTVPVLPRFSTGWTSDRSPVPATGTAPPVTFPSTWPRAPAPGCRPPSARPPSAAWPIPRRSRPTSCGPATCTRCAPGRVCLARQLAEAGADEVLAVDASARMLARAARHPHPRVRYLRGDIEHLDLPAAGPATVWPVDHDSDQGPRQQRWHGRRVLKHHRTPPLLLTAARKPYQGSVVSP